MRVLLVSPNRDVVGGPVAPLGIAILASALEENHQLKIIDLAYSKSWEKTVIEVLALFQPEIILISIRNIDNSDFLNYQNYLPYYVELVRLLRSYSTAKIILGGAGFSIAPKEIMYMIKSDYGIIGSGDTSLPKLITAIELKKSIMEVNNVLYWDSEKLLGTSIEDIYSNTFVRPNRKTIERSFLEYGDLGNIEVTRGCVYKCIYCSIPKMTKKFYVRQIEDVIDELREMKEQGFKKIFFVDNILNFSKSFFEELCKKILINNLDCIEYSCQINPQNMDKELAFLARRAGFTYFQVSALSCDDKVLDKNKKPFSYSDLENLANWCLEIEIKLDLFFVFGLIGETKDTIEKTITCMNLWKRKGISYGYAFGCRVFKNTELYKLLPKNVRTDDLTEPMFYISKYVENNMKNIDDSIIGLKRYVNKSLYEILVRYLKTPVARNKYLEKLTYMKNENWGKDNNV